MKQFTILADPAENPHKKSWYQFWKKRIEEEVVQNNGWQITIKYLRKNSNPINLPEKTIPTDKLYEKTFASQNNCQLSIVNCQLLSLTTLPRIALSKGIPDTRQLSLAFTDDEFTTDYLISLTNLCKSLTIYSQNCPSHIINKIFEQTGYIIELQSPETLHKNSHDLIITNSCTITDFIDKRKYSISAEYAINLDIPLKVNTTRLTNYLLNSKKINIQDCNISVTKL